MLQSTIKTLEVFASVIICLENRDSFSILFAKIRKRENVRAMILNKLSLRIHERLLKHRVLSESYQID